MPRGHLKNPNFYLMLMADAAGISLSLWLVEDQKADEGF